MVSHLLRSILLLAVASAAAQVGAAECSAPAQLKAAQANSVTQVFRAVFMAAPAKGIDCGSIASVWQKVVLREKAGGRKLEPDGALDMAAARRQWDEAQRNPDIAARLAAVEKNTSDPAEVAIFQAAILDEEGLYTARDARIGQLSGAANPLLK